MVYLFSAYLVLWALTFGYLLILGAQQQRLRRDLEHLRERYPPGEEAQAEYEARKESQER